MTVAAAPPIPAVNAATRVSARQVDDPYRLMLIQPGASFSTDDVYQGYLEAFRRRGHLVKTFSADRHISMEQDRQWHMYDYARRQIRQQRKRATAADDQAALEMLDQRKAEVDAKRPTFETIIREVSFRSVISVLTQSPHWTVVFSGMFFHPDGLILLRRAGAYICLILTESPYDDGKQTFAAAFADVVFTNDKGSVDFLRQTGTAGDGRPFGNKNTHYLPHAIIPGKHTPGTRPGDENVPEHDVVFVGSGFAERVELLQQVDWTGIDFGLYGKWPVKFGMTTTNPLRKFLKRPPGAPEGRRLTSSDLIVPNETTAALYRRAKIGLNLHRSSVGMMPGAPRIVSAWSLNPRARELAASGCFTISDYRPEAEEVFRDIEYPTFTTPGELGSLVRRYLSDDAARRRVSEQLPACVVDDTFDARVRYVESVLGAYRRSG